MANEYGLPDPTEYGCTPTDRSRNVALLVGLLQREGKHSGVWFAHHLLDAADTITALRAEVEALRGAFIDLGERELVKPGQLLALGHPRASAIVRDARAALKEPTNAD